MIVLYDIRMCYITYESVVCYMIVLYVIRLYKNVFSDYKIVLYVIRLYGMI